MSTGAKASLDIFSALQRVEEQPVLQSLKRLSYQDSPDDWCVNAWLESSASKSANTMRSYRKEVLRWRAFLMVWKQDVERNDLLITASSDDVRAFIQWIGPEARPSSENDREAVGHRPGDIPQVVGQRLGMSPAQRARPKHSPVVLRQAVIILSGFYQEIQGIDIPGTLPPQKACLVNPFREFRKRFARIEAHARKADEPRGVAKALTPRGWEALWQVASEEPTGTARERMVAARRRFMLAMLRGTWERRSLLADATWADLKRGSDGLWRIFGQRKGKSQPDWAPVARGLMAEVDLFRRAVGLPAFPLPDERHRSLYWIGGRSAGWHGPISDDILYDEIKALFRTAAARLIEQGFPEDAERLLVPGSGPHTIRHTMATQFMKRGGDARLAQKLLRHSSIDTTTKVYDSKEDHEQADALQWQWMMGAEEDAQQPQNERVP